MQFSIHSIPFSELSGDESYTSRFGKASPYEYEPEKSALWQKFFSFIRPNQETQAIQGLNRESSPIIPSLVHEQINETLIGLKKPQSPEKPKTNKANLALPTKFFCRYCPNNYGQLINLKRHLHRVHHTTESELKTLFPSFKDKTTRAYPCPLESCSSGFTRLNDLKRHAFSKHSGNQELIGIVQKMKEGLQLEKGLVDLIPY